jgi:cytochrome c peroxidase
MKLLRARTFLCLGVGAMLMMYGFAASPVAAARHQDIPGGIVNPPAVIALGKALFHDKNLSNPKGLACADCHDAGAAYSYPNSWINMLFGTVPGIVPGRGGNRRPPSIAYAPYLPPGPPHYDQVAQAFVGGLFWDGRVNTALEQIRSPLVNPNEMNNRVHDVGTPYAVVAKIESGAESAAFKEAFGADVFKKPKEQIFQLFAQAIVAYEASPEVSPFTSRYDAYLLGKVRLNSTELLGLRLFTGTRNGRPNGVPFIKSAHCVDCHASSVDWKKSPDLWTNSCYANLGVPRNPLNLFYSENDKRHNPLGFNRQGHDYVDLGLGGFLYDYLGLSEFLYEDPLRINGAFKAPSLRNVDMRPYPGFVRAYMHNGVFKSLKAVVHFYNTRNLTTVRQETIDFTKPHPYEGLKGTPLWAPPEYMDPNSLINPTGLGAGAGSRRPGPQDLDSMQIGNLKMSEGQEDAIVAFLKTLTDGYFKR